MKTALSLSILILGCAGPRKTSPAPATTQGPNICSTAQRLAAGGSFARAADGVAIWYKLAGRKGAPTIAYLHGGPGYNAFAFEQSSGRLLESRFQVLYIDQRGCGRSGFHGSPSQYGMSKTVDDIEQIRASIGVGRLILLGHSFRGLVAAEYARRYPAHVSAIVMIDIAPDVHRALEHQVATIDAVAETKFPVEASRIHAIAQSDGKPFEKLFRLYELLGRVPIQRHLHYAAPQAQEKMERVDGASGIMGCTSSEVLSAFEREGYLLGPRPSVAARITVPTLLIAGRSSHVIGADNIRFAAEIWGARVQWLETGHFVYFERPDEFANAVESFVWGTGILEQASPR